MVKRFVNKLPQLVVILLFINLTACSTIDNLLDTKAKVNYENNKTVKKLDFPPDLTAPEYDNEFALPAGVTNTVSMRTGGVIASTPQSVGSTSSNNKNVTRRDLSALRTQNGTTVLQILDTYPRSLILMDIMLERIGFSVTDRNQATGVYLAKYNGDSEKDGKTLGWFDRVKSALGAAGDESKNSNSLINGNTYQVHIKNQQGYPIVSFKTESGQALSASSNTKVLTTLNNAFNR